MSVAAGPKLAHKGIELFLDAANTRSYPGSGSTWFDVSGNGRNGTLSGNTVPAFVTDANGSMDFTPGVGNSWVYIPHDDNIRDNVFDITTNFTLTAWINIDTARNYGTVIAKANGNNWSHSSNAIWVFISSEVGYIRGVSATGVGTNSFPAEYNRIDYNTNVTGRWINATYTGDGTNAILYINGENVGTFAFSTITSSVTSHSRGITMGTRSENGSGALNANPELDGKVAMVAAYNQALTSAEVLQNYNALKSRFGL